MTSESPFEAKVREQLDRLQTLTLSDIQSQVARKRVDWVDQHPAFIPAGPLSPRQAFELLFFAYMGLSPADLPVVSETPQEVVFRSQNPCPTLDACQRLGLDTRRVCRGAYEKSTQAFLSAIDPQLRFLRSYSEIRPVADYCLERIVRVDFAAAMRIAIREAQQSRREGNKGYGAVVLLGGELLSAAHDTAATDKDPSRHAEVNAVRLATARLGEGDLSGAVLVSTCEPCPMCSSLAVWANLTTLVYGVSIEETACMGKARIRVSAQEIVDRSPAMLEVIGGVLAGECRALYE
jgi:tRNA(Arg) A34 adenosine deaminase TadA